MLTYLGSLTLAVAVPLLGLMDAALLPLIADLQAKAAAMLKLSLAVAITLPAVTAAAMIQAAAKLTLYPPAIGATATLAAAAYAKLLIQIEALLLLPKWNATAGVHMFVYDGPVSGMSSAMASVPSDTGLPPGTPVYAVVLLGGAGATQTALKAVFKTP